MLSNAKGVYIIAQTPFKENDDIDLESVDTLTDFYFSHGASGLTVLGVSGESNKLTFGESVQVANRFIRRAQGKPVIVGVSNPSIAQLDELTKRVMDDGASGVMIAPPNGLRTDQDILNYFEAVFKRIGDVPIVLQDFPFSTGVWMSVPVIAQLIERHPQIQVIKEEDIPSITKITRLRDLPGRRVAILTGNNAMFLPLELGRGIDGPMAGFSHPEMLSSVYNLYTAGKTDEAHKLYNCYLPLLSYENQSQWGVAVRKEVMRRRGALKHAGMRSPSPALDARAHAEIDMLLAHQQQALAALGN
ncbi:dihydrodipicolinate synthase family protein [Paracandidimonas soli]|uniref:4-hydroxy-tetrahydrodipicolinate synthase n=1 Tax=Paracandidimonas soli TaxID=1917182 RepID=A0A4R3V4P2_9BURK|nr:dihydrodipicolinate synthase family protein [Paracandidimonas soli]TCU97274.1 4-hydroxy-tetrahydrodipicolinate synthase [Paracandidimonas soli]